MRKTKVYRRTSFSPEVIQEATARLYLGLDLSSPPSHQDLTVELDDAEWRYDSEEEFFSDYRKSRGACFYWTHRGDRGIDVQKSSVATRIQVDAPNRQLIQTIFEVFERHVVSSLQPESRATIFIGHGRSADWRDLKDHLQDKHGYRIEAYETGARSGHAVRDILQSMMRLSAVAILVLTGEDETSVGDVRARQNVIHEVGLFQGRLGFTRTILLVEDGIELFSNIDGIDHIPFAKGHIAETFGDVLATLRREFESDV